MPVCKVRRDASALGAQYESLLDEKRLVHLFVGTLVFTDGRGKRIRPNRPALELLYHRAEYLVIDGIQSEGVDMEFVQGVPGNPEVYYPAAFHLGEIPHAAQQAVADTRRAAAAHGYLLRRRILDFHLQDARAATHYLHQIRRVVVFHGTGDPEPGTQRSGKQAAAGGSAH